MSLGIHSRSLGILVATLACAVLTGPALAEGEPAGWDWQVTPLYYWSMNIGGETNTEPSEPPTDVDSFDLEFEGAFSLNFDGIYNNRWGFNFDLVGVSLADTKEGGSGPTTKFSFDYWQAELDGYYRTTAGDHRFDFLAGARYYDIETKLEGLPQTREGSKGLVDPIIGVRWSWPINDKWLLSARGDIGGFGIGSDLSYQAVAVAEWFPWQHVGFLAGLRALGLDFEKGSGDNLLELDMTFWGPVIGVSFVW